MNGYDLAAISVGWVEDSVSYFKLSRIVVLTRRDPLAAHSAALYHAVRISESAGGVDRPSGLQQQQQRRRQRPGAPGRYDHVTLTCIAASAVPFSSRFIIHFFTILVFHVYNILHRIVYAKQQMRPIVADLPWSQQPCPRSHELCKNGGTDRAVVWRADSCGPEELWGPGSAGEGAVWGKHRPVQL